MWTGGAAHDRKIFATAKIARGKQYEVIAVGCAVASTRTGAQSSHVRKVSMEVVFLARLDAGEKEKKKHSCARK